MHGSYARITLAATGESLGLSSKTGVKSRIITSLYCDRTNQGRIRNESGVLQHYLLTCLYGNTCRTNQERANRVTPHQWKMRVTPHQWKMRSTTGTPPPVENEGNFSNTPTSGK